MTGGVAGDLERAAMLLDAGRAVDAERLARQAVASTPGSADAWLVLARSLEPQEKYVDMLAAATRATALAPDSAQSHICRSDALSSLDRRWDAVDAAREALRLGPHWWLAHARLAETLAAAGQHRPPWHVSWDFSRRSVLREGVRHGERAVALAPEKAGAWGAMGIALAAAGRRRSAAQAYRTSLRLDPASAAAANNLALLDMRRGRLAKATGLLLAAARAEPTGGVWIDNLGVVVVRTMTSAILVLLAADAIVAVVTLFGAGGPYIRALVVLTALVLASARAANVARTFPRSALKGIVRRLWTTPGFRFTALTLGVVVFLTVAVGFAPNGFWSAVLGGSVLSALRRVPFLVFVLARALIWIVRDDDNAKGRS
jgi:tetratricopeptide (TPR) repeat protein